MRMSGFWGLDEGVNQANDFFEMSIGSNPIILFSVPPESPVENGGRS